MSRLTRYLLGQYARDAAALFAVAAILVWLIQMLRLFDLVTAKGQGLLTLAGQAFLTTPPLTRELLFICMAIGLSRGLQRLQDSRELHSIHIMQRTSKIWTALAVYAAIGAVIVSIMAHWAVPEVKQAGREMQAQIAAELVGENIVPGRFTEVTQGVVVRIGGREPDGTITGFFADDSRNPDRHSTYFADSAVILQTDDGYQISLRDGRLQLVTEDEPFSEVEFARYELAIDSLTETGEARTELNDWNTLQLLQIRQNQANRERQVDELLFDRIADATRLIALLLCVAAVQSFPHARRGNRYMPTEVLIIGGAFVEHFSSGSAADSSVYGPFAGTLILLSFATLVLVYQLRGLIGKGRRKKARAEVPT